MRRMISLGLVFVMVLALFDGSVEGQQKHRKRPRAAKKTSPTTQSIQTKANYGSYDFTMRSIDGAQIHLGSYGGKVVLVTIWSASCEPCKAETPGYVKLYNRYHSRGFEVISVGVQTSETEMRSYIQENDIRWICGIHDSIITVYGMYGLPDHYLFSTSGGLIKHFVGYTRGDVIEPYIEQSVKTVVPKAPLKK